MASKIDSITKRRKLDPRREPYWHKLGKGRYLGFRLTQKGESWIARIRNEEGKQNYHSLGTGLDFDQASTLAQNWFDSVENVDDVHYTIKACVDDYVAHLRVENGEVSSKRIKQTLEKHLIPQLGKLELAKLTTRKLKRWRDGLVRFDGDDEDTRRSKDSANRVLSLVKAAFNLAYRDRQVSSDREWKRVEAYKGVGEGRKLFLTDKQIRTLYEATNGGLHALVKAGVLTGARYGELGAARVHDLDVINGTLHLDGKTGPRDCHLSDDALSFLKEQAKDKLPDAYLFTKDDGTPWGKSHQQRPMKAAVKAAKLPKETVFYSLRHYHISKVLLAGVPAQIVAENCGTSIKMLEKHYAKFMATDRRRMMNQVSLG